MAEDKIKFEDGAGYERMMGTWSRIAGEVFLQWLAPAPGLRWVDVGCGNGAFTELLVERCAPSNVQGIDPSEDQLAFARTRLATRAAQFQVGDAMALPYADGAFDAAVMALVIFFVPEPAKGVAELARVVRPGGSVSAYAWDVLGGGFPFAALREEMAALGSPPLLPPSPDASRLDVLRELWTGAGLAAVQTQQFTMQRTFADFDAFWKIARTGPSIAPKIAAMANADVELLMQRLRERMTPDADGRITCGARANAVKGLVRG